jgi:hypothetical protein
MREEAPSPSEVLAVYGEAMLEAQRLEEAMVGLLGVRAELDAAERQDWEEFTRAQEAWEGLFTMTAGRLRTLLALEGELGDELERAVDARNLLTHHYLRDRGWALNHQPAERKRMAAALRASAERFHALAQRLDGERLRAMEEHGLTEDHVTTPGEARNLRYWNPTTDEIEPPEPWDLDVPGA